MRVFTQFQTSFQAKPPYQKKLGRFFKAPLMYRFSQDHEDQRHKKNIKNLGLDLIKKALLPSLV